MRLYKLTIEEINGEKSFHFFLDGHSIDELFSGEYPNLTIADAKTLESFTIREKIFDALQIEEMKRDITKLREDLHQISPKFIDAIKRKYSDDQQTPNL